jgi:FKBP-type peptidyl-prolyl cis-trans isomerase
MKKYFLLPAIILTIGFTGCIDKDYWDKLDEENKILQQYIIDNEYEVYPSYSGLFFIDLYQGDDVYPNLGDVVLFNFTGRTLVGERVFTTSNMDTAIFHDLYDSTRLYGPTSLIAGNFSPQGVNEGIMYMTQSGEARMIFPSTLGFGSKAQGDIPGFSSLIYDIELVRVISDPFAYETEQISNYLAENEISAIKDEVGLYYSLVEEGTGDKPLFTSTVEVTYSAHLIDGRMLAESVTRNIKLDNISELFGLTRGILKMKEGEKAKIIMPFNLGFGGSTIFNPDYGYKVPVPAYSTIIYDIELVNIQ